MSKYTTISKWEPSLILASYFLLADYLLIKLISEVSLNLFHAIQTATQIIKFSPNNIISINK